MPLSGWFKRCASAALWGRGRKAELWRKAWRFLKQVTLLVDLIRMTLTTKAKEVASSPGLHLSIFCKQVTTTIRW